MEVDLRAQNEELTFPKDCSDEMKDLIIGMTKKNRKDRMNIERVIENLLKKKIWLNVENVIKINIKWWKKFYEKR